MLCFIFALPGLQKNTFTYMFDLRRKTIKIKAASFARIPKRICDLRSYEFFTTKENGRSQEDHLP